MKSRSIALLLALTLCLPTLTSAQQHSYGKKYAALLAGAAVLMPFDETIRSAAASPTYQDNGILRSSEKGLFLYGQPGVLVISVLATGAGLVAGSPKLTDAGLHTTEAIVASGTITWLLKGIAGRERPNANPDDPYDFTLGGGWNGDGGASFPSGHATASFAFASTVVEEIRLHNPKASRYAAPALYGIATLVGASRIYKQKHWASDVMLGAAIGYISGKEIFKLNHAKDAK